jgi:LRP1 type putative zinc finger protein
MFMILYWYIIKIRNITSILRMKRVIFNKCKNSHEISKSCYSFTRDRSLWYGFDFEKYEVISVYIFIIFCNSLWFSKFEANNLRKFWLHSESFISEKRNSLKFCGNVLKKNITFFRCKTCCFNIKRSNKSKIWMTMNF